MDYEWNPTAESAEKAAAIVRRQVVVDLHTHPQGVVPAPVRKFAERVAKVPHDPLANLRPGGVNVAVVTAVGDPMGTIWRGRGPWAAVDQQLKAAEAESSRAGIDVMAGNMVDPALPGRTRAVLGVEGTDFLGNNLERLAEVKARGIGVLGLVHYADNKIGTIGTSLLGRRGSRATITGKRRRGLSGFGRDLVAELNRERIVIDLAHADLATTLDVCAIAGAPVISSHTAAAALRDFPRYTPDEGIRAIAGTGGVIGLWPISLRNLAMNDLTDFARHAAHIANLVGVEHIGVGTDKNGVTSYADGYTSSQDTVHLAAALLDIGFNEGETAAVLGGNALRVLEAVRGPAA